MIKPNFFMIGEPKCGTTIIHDYLSQHKDVFMSNPKEPHHFNTDHYKESILFHGEKKAKSIFRYMDLKKYLSLFQGLENYKIIGEASTNYAYSKKSAENIYNFNKDSKIVYCIREPLSFLISYHGQLYKMGKEQISDFFKALKFENKKKTENIFKYTNYPSFLCYSERIKYSEHLQRYLDYFPKKQIKVIIYEEFKKDNQKIINEMIDFLGVDKIKIEYKELNVRAKPKYPRLHRFLINNYTIRSVAQKILPYKVRKKWGDFTRKINPLIKEKAPEIPEKERIKLMKKYKLEVVKINDLLHKYTLIDSNIDLVKYWGYDKI